MPNVQFYQVRVISERLRAFAHDNVGEDSILEWVVVRLAEASAVRRAFFSAANAAR